MTQTLSLVPSTSLSDIHKGREVPEERAFVQNTSVKSEDLWGASALPSLREFQGQNSAVCADELNPRGHLTHP